MRFDELASEIQKKAYREEIERIRREDLVNFNAEREVQLQRCYGIEAEVHSHFSYDGEVREFGLYFETKNLLTAGIFEAISRTLFRIDKELAKNLLEVKAPVKHKSNAFVAEKEDVEFPSYEELVEHCNKANYSLSRDEYSELRFSVTLFYLHWCEAEAQLAYRTTFNEEEIKETIQSRQYNIDGKIL